MKWESGLMLRCCVTRSDGFTLLEVVLVVLVMGIMLVSVSPHWQTRPINLALDARHLLQDIRYARMMSINTGQRYRWEKLSATTYRVTDASGAAVLLPSGATVVTLQQGVVFAALSQLPNNLIAFDTAGVPYVDAAYPGVALTGTASIPVTVDGKTISLSIAPHTGYGVLSS